MKDNYIFVTGFFGAPILDKARAISIEKNMPLVVLDDEIKISDGRSVKRICMMMGEHEYRNKEYEAIKALVDGNTHESAVVCCGDGVLHDDMSRELILKHNLIVVGAKMDIDVLFKNALGIENSTHAFMYFGDLESKKKAFKDLYERQKLLFNDFL